MRKRSLKIRGNKGASIGLVAMGALLVIIAIFAAFQLAIFMGGSRELRNTVDAAALNVSKRMIEVKLPPDPMYSDIADSTGNVGLTNINRLWAKAYLINANQEAMMKEGYSTAESNGSASTAYTKAVTTNATLATMLNSKNTGDQYFKQMAGTKPARLLGADGTVTTNTQSAWAVAMVNRGDESNITYQQQQLPDGAQPNGFNQNGKLWLRGYTPFTANGQSFCFTTFRNNEMPHLISDTVFGQNQSPIPQALNPIPNAFRESGQTSAMQTISAAANAVANPQRQFSMAIPHSFVTITITNQAQWFVQGQQVATTNYGFTKQTQQGVKKWKLKDPASGLLDGFASLGNEYANGNNLWTALNALPGDHTTPAMKLVQRINEFKPGFTLQNLEQLLQGQNIVPNANTYFIYPVYSSPDSTNPTVRIASSPSQMPAWFNPGPGMGSSNLIVTEAMQKNQPNYCWDIITEGKYASGAHWTEVSGKIFWQPGTGAGQNLGNLRIGRLTQCMFTGLPAP